MEIKKSPKADLEGNKTLGFLMGLVVGLAVLFVGFEWGSQGATISKNEGISDILAEEEIEITRQEETPPEPPPPPPEQVTAEVLNIVEDDVNVDTHDLASSEDNQMEAQTEVYVPAAVEDEEESENHIFMVVEEMPEFPGGVAALMSYISKSINYPVVAQENGIQGRVNCRFTVNKDGSIEDVEILRGVDPSLDREAIRVIKGMPKWKAGKQRGKPVRVKFTVPINFRLQNS